MFGNVQWQMQRAGGYGLQELQDIPSRRTGRKSIRPLRPGPDPRGNAVRQHENTYARALARAAEIAGSIEALAVKLHISPPIVRAWINGTQEVPVPVFLTVVDLLMDKELAEIRQP